ncbi:shikimate kinase [Sporolactobacillus spathodeae]|uniref:Shikimate kinase n=1 Tax=Sporolactobacillus spathodeae TaxID=1465502 RepID=A0ABS2Q4X1_9BACL|nr:shikimate kinase [Sporolactobacillus spathodeae]MBM7656839.1 shikimate kinase [Sporolactobacillus spathodeae]
MATILLIGFMGSGKTTVGKQLAEYLHQPHLDLDAWIEAHSGQSIKQIFTDHGETFFRDLESEALSAAIRQEGVLSTGGGTPVRSVNRKLLASSGSPVIFLQTSPEVIVNRLKNDASRPLLQSMDNDQFIELYQKRKTYYQQSADIIVDTDQKSPSEIAHEILIQIGIYFLKRLC